MFGLGTVGGVGQADEMDKIAWDFDAFQDPLQMETLF